MSEWDKFTIFGGVPADGEVTGFTLTLDGDAEALTRIIRAVWAEMVKVSHERNAELRNRNDALRGHPLRQFLSEVYEGPTGELHVRRKFP